MPFAKVIPPIKSPDLRLVCGKDRLWWSMLWRGHVRVTYIIRLGWLWAPLFWCVTYVYSRCDMIEWIILLYSQWMVWSKAKPYFSMKSRYIDIEGVLNFMQLKVQRVFLSYKVVTLSSEYLIFYHQHNARQLSNRSIFHAGHISVLKYRDL